MTHLPPLKSQACVAQLSALDDATLSRELIQSWVEKFGVICVSPGNIFFHPTSLWDSQKVPPDMWNAVVNAFQPAPKFRELINQAIASMPSRQFITVHVRVEEDANKHCQQNHGEKDGSDFWGGRRYDSMNLALPSRNACCTYCYGIAWILCV